MYAIAAATILLLDSLATPAGSPPRPRYAQPTTNALFQMQRMNSGHPWLRISTDSGQSVYKVATIDRVGLYDLTPREGEGEPQPGPVPWARIARIDELVTRAPQMRRVGGFVLGLTGAGLGNALGAPNQDGARFALLGAGIGALAGAVLGGHYGEGLHRPDRPWYTEAERDTSEVPALDSLASMSPLVAHACREILPGRRVRVSGTFGGFVGYVGMAGPEGLERLRSTSRVRRGEQSSVPERIEWSEIDLVERKAGSVLYGSLGGAGVFGAIGALGGAALVAVLGQGSDTEVYEGAAVGFAILAPIGAGVGGLIGTAVRRWVPIYRRPPSP